jgi:transcriptional activator of comK gene
MKRLLFILITAIAILPGCSYFEGNNLQNVGMLFESEIENNAWNEKGYEGLMSVGQEFQTDVFYKENIRAEHEVLEAVDEFVREGVNFVIGHGNSYGHYFVELTKSFPDVHFIYMNGDLYNPNVTSLNFDSHAMGFFAGMAAGEMTETNQIGVLAVFSWQPELEGFYEGVKYRNPAADIHIDFVNDWDDEEQALLLYEEFLEEEMDVVLPIGNAYNKAVIERAAQDNVYSIGYVADQHELAPDHVLMSMVQHVDEVLLRAARDFNEGGIDGGIRSYDFHEDFIELGTFHEDIPDDVETDIRNGIEAYQETNLLPNEK